VLSRSRAGLNAATVENDCDRYETPQRERAGCGQPSGDETFPRFASILRKRFRSPLAVCASEALLSWRPD